MSIKLNAISLYYIVQQNCLQSASLVENNQIFQDEKSQD